MSFLAFAAMISLPLAAAAQDEPIPEGLETVVVEASEVETLLGRIVTPGVPEDVAQAAFDDLVHLGASATPELIAVYQDPADTEHRRWVAARALGHMGGRAASEALMEGMRAQEFMSRIAATSALGVMQGDDARMALEEALFDPSMEIRCTAADGLLQIGHQASSVPLARALGTPDSFHRGRSLPVRGHIVLALGGTGGETAIEALIGVLDDRDELLRATAIKALEEASGASPSGVIGNGRTATPAEVEAWKDWWDTHQRALGVPVEEAPLDEGQAG
jgi:HEAT repeat protein